MPTITWPHQRTLRSVDYYRVPSNKPPNTSPPPRRIALTNQDADPSDDNVELVAQFNPTNLTEEIAANWARITVPGLSHEQLQFVNCSNYKLKMDLHFRATSFEEALYIHRARLLLLAWNYPRTAAADVKGGRAPRLLVTWPGMLSFIAILTNVSINHTRFNRMGQSVAFTATIQLEEISDVHLTFDSVALDSSTRLGDPLMSAEILHEHT